MTLWRMFSHFLFGFLHVENTSSNSWLHTHRLQNTSTNFTTGWGLSIAISTPPPVAPFGDQTAFSHHYSGRPRTYIVAWKTQGGLENNLYLFSVYFHPAQGKFPISERNGDLTPQLFGSCWPITNEWLRGSFWTLYAQCCWHEGWHSPKRPYTVVVNSLSVCTEVRT